MIKRLFDVVVAAAALLLLLPLIIALALCVLVFNGMPILFRQTRPGLDGKPFVIYKFRTMAQRKGNDGDDVPDSKRLTGIGRFLRATSLDELPEFFNVLGGSMSLVGPRPLLMEYLPLYSAQQARRHEVRPGITGWAQVNGRNSLSWEEKFELDVWYVDNRSFLLDLKILLMTLTMVLKREGISHPGESTMPKFRGKLQ